jgi:thioesterase domain-containing protein
MCQTLKKCSAHDRANILLEPIRTAWNLELGEMPLDTTSWQESGGDSVRMLSLLLQLETITDKRLPLELFSSEMTPRSLARGLATFLSETADQRSTERPLVFLLPLLGGDHPRLARFRANLSETIRFQVIEHPSWREMIKTANNFGAIVDAATDKILVFGGSDLYLLAGESFGGLVAWETARRLLALGCRVGFVGLLDTRPPELILSRALYSWTIRDFLLRPRQTALTVIADPLVKYLPLPLVDIIRRLVEHLPPRIAFRLNHRFAEVFRRRLLKGFVLRPLQVPAFLFRSAEDLEFPDYGWKALCPQLTIVPVGGPHVFVYEERALKILCDRFLEAVHQAAGDRGL